MLVIAGLLVATVALVNAQSSTVTCPDGSSPQGRVSVTGQGSIKTLPDSATIILSVEVTRKNATEARESGSIAVNATLTALATAGLSADAISTPGLTLQPGYEYEPSTGAIKSTGVIFAQTLEIKLTNVTADTISTLIDTAVAASPALQVSSVSTTLSPEKAKEITSSARQLAVADAVNTASVLSQAAGVALGPFTMITDNHLSLPGPHESAPSADAADGPNPERGTPTQYVIGSGQYETLASVSMEISMCRVTRED